MPYLTIKEPLIGRLGNQLFQVNFASQIATRIKVPLKMRKNEVLKLSNLNVELSSGLGLKPKKMQFLDRRFILEQDAETIYGLCISIIQENRVIALPSGMLGEVFFKFLLESPRNLFVPRKHLNSSDEEKLISSHRVALHFRGGDLKEQDIPCDQIDLFTDDPAHPTVTRLKTELKVGKVISSNNQYRDFWAMSNYGTLVISPSTFSVWASLLGCPKKVIYNGNWYESEGVKEVFWSKFIETNHGFTKKMLAV